MQNAFTSELIGSVEVCATCSDPVTPVRLSGPFLKVRFAWQCFAWSWLVGTLCVDSTDPFSKFVSVGFGSHHRPQESPQEGYPEL